MNIDSIFQTVDNRLKRIEEVRMTMEDLSSLQLEKVVSNYPISWKVRDFFTEVLGGRIPSSAVYYRAAKEELKQREDHTLY